MILYRKNVAGLFLNEEGKLLICERLNTKNAWQFPQGGMDEGETELETLQREVLEEIGIAPEFYDVIEQRGGYRYLYPADVRAKKLMKHGNHGQEQTYFLCRLKPNAPDVNVDQPSREFSDYKWIEPDEFLIQWVPMFKRGVYSKVFLDFFKLKI